MARKVIRARKQHDSLLNILARPALFILHHRAFPCPLEKWMGVSESHVCQQQQGPGNTRQIDLTHGTTTSGAEHKRSHYCFSVSLRGINISLCNVLSIAREMHFSSRQHFWTTMPCYILPLPSNLHMTTPSFCDPRHHMCAHTSRLSLGIFSSCLQTWTTLSRSHPSIH